MGRELRLGGPPQRIVSLVPSLTEALFAFGAGERVVGVTRFCVEPRTGVRARTKVGGTKNVDVAGVASLAPDMVIANVEENTRDDVHRMIAAGLTVFLTYPRTVADAIDELQQLAEIVGPSAEATAIVRASRVALGEALRDKRPRARIFCPIWRDPWMTIGPDTYMHDLITVCGGLNVFGERNERYPSMELFEIGALTPEVVLLPDEPYHFRKRHIPEVIEWAPAARIYLVDGKDLCWYGPRIPEGIRTVRGILRGES